ncbi:MAG: type I-E CRISPR-associated protein Cas6/Cse3/CasE [Chloroflexi bacterium]|nr:type I-E CRISPR-associated protein Cas6/Cse3/CasE [Chloroflexota bacterium]
MYLSHLALNPRSRQAQHDLADCQRMHRTLMACFPSEVPGDPRAALGLLYRVETAPRTGEVTLLVQSAAPPDWSRLAPGYLKDVPGSLPNPDTKAVGVLYDRLTAGAVLRFRIAANPSKKVMTKSDADGRRRNGKRADLRDEADQLVWLDRKAEQHGFRILSVRSNAEVRNVDAAPQSRVTGWRGGGPDGEEPQRRLTLARVQFDGLLRVTDALLFRSALEGGIGPGKAYGFGLLSVAPAR